MPGLRSLLRQWVKGDPSKGAPIPLSQFSVEQRNGRDSSGKSIKYLHSKRRTVALATMMALRKAKNLKISFEEAIGQVEDDDCCKWGMRQWEETAKKFLTKSSRNISQEQLESLQKEVYNDKTLSLLPLQKN